MSWAISYPTREAFESDTREAGSATDDADGQVLAARAAASSLISSGAVGAQGKDFSVSLSGHTNPNHEPAPGWANDCISVSVTQKS